MTDWIFDNWIGLSIGLGVLYALANAITAVTPTPLDDEFLKQFVNGLSFLDHYDSSKRLKMPGKVRKLRISKADVLRAKVKA